MVSRKSRARTTDARETVHVEDFGSGTREELSPLELKEGDDVLRG